MKVVPFRKQSRFANSESFGRKHDDEFDREIETMRANQPLMATLEDRAKQPATVSLQDVKDRIESDGD